MSERRIPWSEISWEAGDHPLEMKKLAPGTPCVLLRFLPGFADPNFCERSHVLHVIEGELTIELRDRTEHCGPGESYVLHKGTAHRARNDGVHDLTVLAITDVSWA